MLSNYNQFRNFTANSKIDSSVVSNMNANYDGNNINFSHNIIDYDLYMANKNVVDGDYSEFTDLVLAEIGE